MGERGGGFECLCRLPIDSLARRFRGSDDVAWEFRRGASPSSNVISVISRAGESDDPVVEFSDRTVRGTKSSRPSDLVQESLRSPITAPAPV